MKSKRPRSHDRILRLLDAQTRALSAQEIFVALRERQQALGLATIYRALDALKLDGQLQVRTQAGESLYSRVTQPDRHHLTCLQCGRSVPLDRCPVRDLEQQLQQSHQFEVFYHTLEFFGRCKCCSAAASQDCAESS
ncbi:MAG: Fur family transcriptional regulator [Geitlerinemataceae cyanobacterium]